MNTDLSGNPDQLTTVRRQRDRYKAEVDRLREALLDVAAFAKHPHPAPCGTDACVLCFIEIACAEALGDSA